MDNDQINSGHVDVESSGTAISVGRGWTVDSIQCCKRLKGKKSHCIHRKRYK
jgi:hypothetical protein